MGLWNYINMYLYMLKLNYTITSVFCQALSRQMREGCTGKAALPVPIGNNSPVQKRAGGHINFT
jgi:hypothetical protein